MTDLLLAYQDQDANAWEVRINLDLASGNDQWCRNLAGWILENLPSGMGGFGASTPVSIFVLGTTEQREISLTP